MKNFISVSLMIIGLMFSTLTQADNLKIGVINLETIISQAPQTEQIKSRLKNQFQKREDGIVTAQKDLQEQINKINRDRSIMAETDLKAAEEKINNQKRDLVYKQQAFREDFMRSQNNEMDTLLKKIRSEIQTIASKQGYDLVLQEESVPFVAKKMDITEMVITALKVSHS